MLPDNEELFSNYFTLRSVTENTKNVYLATLKKWDEVTGIPLHDLDEKNPGPVVQGLSTFSTNNTIARAIIHYLLILIKSLILNYVNYVSIRISSS